MGTGSVRAIAGAVFAAVLVGTGASQPQPAPAGEPGFYSWSDAHSFSGSKSRISVRPAVGLGDAGFAFVGGEGLTDGSGKGRPWYAARVPGSTRFYPHIHRAGRSLPRTTLSGLAGDIGVGTIAWLFESDSSVHVRNIGTDGELTPQVQISEPGARGLRLDVADDGTALAAWRGEDGVELSYRGPGGEFGPPELISHAQVVPNAVAVAPGGGAVVAWTRLVDNDLRRTFVAVRAPGESEFAAERVPMPKNAEPRFAGIEMTTTGRVVTLRGGAAVNAGTTKLRAAVRELDTGFSDPVEVSGDESLARPLIDSDAAGAVTVVWQEQRNHRPYGSGINELDLSGAWSGPQNLSARRRLLLSDFDISPAGARIFGFGGRGGVFAAVARPGQELGRVRLISDRVEPGEDAQPDVAVDDSGAGIILWASSLRVPGRVFFSSRTVPPTP